MNDAAVCSNCSERGHHAEKCPDLYAPLKEGFYSGESGMDDGMNDDGTLQITFQEVVEQPCTQRWANYPLLESIKITRKLMFIL